VLTTSAALVSLSASGLSSDVGAFRQPCIHMPVILTEAALTSVIGQAGIEADGLNLR
jgi:hypothetical protein